MSIEQGGSSHAEPEAASAPPPGPEIPPAPPDIQRVMDKVQKRDLFHIFKEPVTDAMVSFTLLLVLQLPACRCRQGLQVLLETHTSPYRAAVSNNALMPWQGHS